MLREIYTQKTNATKTASTNNEFTSKKIGFRRLRLYHDT
jgi:hypothetical protein